MNKLANTMLWFSIPLLGLLFSWRLYMIPSRAELAIFFAIIFMVPSFIYPKISLYYLLIIPSFIPMFRRLYYLLADRPDLDYIMLITDGVLISMFIAIIMLWVKFKEANRDKLSIAVIALVMYMFLKIFIIQRWPIKDGFYSFKYYGMYIMFYFAGKYLIQNMSEFKKSVSIISGVLFCDCNLFNKTSLYRAF